MNPPPLSQPAIVESHQPSSVSSDATSRPHRPRSPEERERHRESHRPRPGADLRWLSGRRSRSRSPRRRAITPDRSSSPYRGDRQRRSPHRRQYRAEELREEESQERHRDWRGGEQRYDARPRSPPRHDTSAAPLHSSSPSSVQRMDDYVQRLSSTSSDEQRAAAEIPPLPTPTSSSHSSHTSRSRVSFHPSRNAPAASLSSASFRHASPTSSTPAAEVDESNVGHRMLKQLGWTEGQGLGRHRSGITAPIEAQQRPQGQGVGHDRRDTADAGGGDQYDAYKRQMQERYKHRPNPLGNPRHVSQPRTLNQRTLTPLYASPDSLAHPCAAVVLCSPTTERRPLDATCVVPTTQPFAMMRELQCWQRTGAGALTATAATLCTTDAERADCREQLSSSTLSLRYIHTACQDVTLSWRCTFHHSHRLDTAQPPPHASRPLTRSRTRSHHPAQAASETKASQHSTPSALNTPPPSPSPSSPPSPPLHPTPLPPAPPPPPPPLANFSKSSAADTASPPSLSPPLLPVGLKAAAKGSALSSSPSGKAGEEDWGEGVEEWKGMGMTGGREEGGVGVGRGVRWR